MEELRVSVIIPSYNHSRFLKQRIDSVLRQTYCNSEVFILDDCSTDESREIIETFRGHEKVKYIHYNSTNSQSPFKQWKKGIELATGSYIWIAESDDYCEPDFLETLVETIKINDCSVVYCQSFKADENSNVIGDYFYWTTDITAFSWDQSFVIDGKSFIEKALKFKNVIPNASAVIFRKEGFDFTEIVNYRMKGDWLFWIKILMQGKICYLPLRQNFFRSHASTTRDQWSNLRNVRSHVEELAIKYYLFTKSFATRDEVQIMLKQTVKIALPYYQEYKRLCAELALPKSFLFQFWIRKFELKFRRTFTFKM